MRFLLQKYRAWRARRNRELLTRLAKGLVFVDPSDVKPIHNIKQPSDEKTCLVAGDKVMTDKGWMDVTKIVATAPALEADNDWPDTIE